MSNAGRLTPRGSALRVAMLALALAALTLAACGPVVATPPVVAIPGPHPQSVPKVAPQTAASSAMRAYYGQVQQSLLSQGLLRTDMGGPDAPFTDRNLTDNFLKIALFEEYAHGEVTQIRSENPIRLVRWDQPVRVALRFGDSVPARVRATDTATIRSFLARLTRIAGHQISLDDRMPNFWIHIASVDERAALGPVLTTELSELTPGQIASVTNMDRDTYCQVLNQSNPATSTYVAAVAVIPSEHPDLLRLSCVHEELAQAMGLPNDSKAARPSIFNDDEEFALLTRQDELMLRMLYDPALRPGMTEAEARPVVEALAAKLMAGGT